MKELLGIILVGAFALASVFFGLGMLATDGELIGDLTVDQMVATDVAAGLIAANTATPEPILGPSATPTAYAPPQVAPVMSPNGDWIVGDGRVVIKALEATKFYRVAEGEPASQVGEGIWLNLEFELEGHPGWYGVVYDGQEGFVRMYEFNLPEGIYTQENLRDLIPWGQWPQ